MKLIALFMISAAMLIISESYLARRRAAVRALEDEATLIDTVYHGWKERRGRLAELLSESCADIPGGRLCSIFFDKDGRLREGLQKHIKDASEEILPNRDTVCDFFAKIQKGEDAADIQSELCARAKELSNGFRRHEAICRTLVSSAAASFILLVI